jgi:hypothetical protein
MFCYRQERSVLSLFHLFYSPEGRRSGGLTSALEVLNHVILVGGGCFLTIAWSIHSSFGASIGTFLMPGRWRVVSELDHQLCETLFQVTSQEMSPFVILCLGGTSENDCQKGQVQFPRTWGLGIFAPGSHTAVRWVQHGGFLEVADRETVVPK